MPPKIKFQKKKVTKAENPLVFINIGFEGELVGGTIVFELFADVCPITAENFRVLINGGNYRATGYQGLAFHRVMTGLLVQGGDNTNFDGTGGTSSFGAPFPDENFEISHSEPYMLSMANFGENTNSSQFFITSKAAPDLDCRYVCFGKAISGFHVIQNMTKVPTKTCTDVPRVKIIINSCGEIDNEAKKKEHLKIKQKEKKSVSTVLAEQEEQNEKEITDAVQKGILNSKKRPNINPKQPAKKKIKALDDYEDLFS